ncbi:hypothetical protein SDSG_00050 [Ruegeria phage DSS3-P1]|nr:hypothetical protein SDSG_00050 [Ruegeria phage DSS3-P1]
MSRWSSSGSKGHHIERLFHDCYRLSWTVDRYYSRSRLRHPTRYSRDTDEAGARRFAKKWGVNMPKENEND